jgi:hypothetical protein
MSPLWWTPMPPERLAALRIAMGGYGVVATAVQFSKLANWSHFSSTQFQPVGVVKLVLDAPLHAAVMPAAWALTLVFGVLFIVGWRFRWTAPVYVALLLWVYSYRSSWGQIFHTDNLLVLHTAILACARSADRWAIGVANAPDEAGGPRERYGWPVRLMATVTVLAYFVAGVAKLRYAGPSWVTGPTLMHHVAWDNLRKIELGDVYSPLGPWLLRFPSVFVALAIFTMAIELLAPLALFHGGLARAWCLGMWGFHFGILLLMAIVFAYPLSGIAFLPFFQPERWLSRWFASLHPLHAIDKRIEDARLHRLTHDR